MGNDFDFENKTKNIVTDFNKIPWEYKRNIDRGNGKQLYDTIFNVIKLENWDITDDIIFRCYEHPYVYIYKNGVIFRDYDLKKIVVDNDDKIINDYCNLDYSDFKIQSKFYYKDGVLTERNEFLNLLN